MRSRAARQTVPLAIGLDPGKWKMGRAVGRDGLIVSAEVVRTPPARTWSEHAAVVAALSGAPQGAVWWVECPQVRAGGRVAVKADVAELESLTRNLKASATGTVNLLDPFEWKRQVPKAVHHRRIMSLLSPAETAVVQAALTTAKDGKLDLMDAVGILLYGLGRCGPGGTHA